LAHPTVNNHVRHVLAEALRSPELVPLVHELYYASADYHQRVTLPSRSTEPCFQASGTAAARIENRVRNALSALQAKGVRLIPFNLDELCEAVADVFT